MEVIEKKSQQLPYKNHMIMKYLFFSLLFFISTFAQGSEQLAYRVYSMQFTGIQADVLYSGSSELNGLHTLFLNSIQKPSIFLKVENDFNDFLDKFENKNSKPVNEIAVLPFAIKDGDYFTFRVFLYDLTNRKLVNQFEAFTEKDTLKSAILKLAESFVNGYDVQRGYTSTLAFDECLFHKRYDYLYKVFLDTMSGFADGNSEEYHRKGTSVKEIMKSFIHYIETGNATDLRNLRKLKDGMIRESGRGRVNRQSRDRNLPNLWAMIEAVVQFEDFKRHGVDIQNVQQKYLMAEIDSLDVRMLTKKELKQFLKAELEYDEVYRSLKRSSTLIANCRNVFTQGDFFEQDEDYVKASSLYFEVLKNEDLNPILKEMEKYADDDADCSNLKKNARDRLIGVIEKRKEDYQKVLKKADAYFESENYEKALEAYTVANKINNKASLYPVWRQKACLKHLEIKDIEPFKQQVLENIKDNINAPFGIANSDGTMYNRDIENSINGSTSTISITTDVGKTKVRSWLDENSYGLGKYRSANEEKIIRKLADGLLESLNDYRTIVKSIKLEVTGSSDNAKFVKKFYIPEKEYKSFNAEVTMCDSGKSYRFSDLKIGSSKTKVMLKIWL